MAAHQPRPKKADLLKQGLAASGGTLDELQSLASSLNLMEDRYMARPAAELMVAHKISGVPVVDTRNALRGYSAPTIVRLSGRVVSVVPAQA